MRSIVREFFNDETARDRYETLSRIGRELAERQSQGNELTSDEISAYEDARAALDEVPGTAGFFDAQHQLQRLEGTLHAYITRTLQLGRVPEPEDFSCGNCGSGCDCHENEQEHVHDGVEDDGFHDDRRSVAGAENGNPAGSPCASGV